MAKQQKATETAREPDLSHVVVRDCSPLSIRALVDLASVDAGLETLQHIAAEPHDSNELCRKVRFIADSLRRLVKQGAIRPALLEFLSQDDG